MLYPGFYDYIYGDDKLLAPATSLSIALGLNQNLISGRWLPTYLIDAAEKKQNIIAHIYEFHTIITPMAQLTADGLCIFSEKPLNTQAFPHHNQYVATSCYQENSKNKKIVYNHKTIIPLEYVPAFLATLGLHNANEQQNAASAKAFLTQLQSVSNGMSSNTKLDDAKEKFKQETASKVEKELKQFKPISSSLDTLYIPDLQAFPHSLWVELSPEAVKKWFENTKGSVSRTQSLIHFTLIVFGNQYLQPDYLQTLRTILNPTLAEQQQILKALLRNAEYLPKHACSSLLQASSWLSDNNIFVELLKSEPNALNDIFAINSRAPDSMVTAWENQVGAQPKVGMAIYTAYLKNFPHQILALTKLVNKLLQNTTGLSPTEIQQLEHAQATINLQLSQEQLIKFIGEVNYNFRHQFGFDSSTWTRGGSSPATGMQLTENGTVIITIDPNGGKISEPNRQKVREQLAKCGLKWPSGANSAEFSLQDLYPLIKSLNMSTTDYQSKVNDYNQKKLILNTKTLALNGQQSTSNLSASEKNVTAEETIYDLQKHEVSALTTLSAHLAAKFTTVFGKNGAKLSQAITAYENQSTFGQTKHFATHGDHAGKLPLIHFTKKGLSILLPSHKEWSETQAAQIAALVIGGKAISTNATYDNQLYKQEIIIPAEKVPEFFARLGLGEVPMTNPRKEKEVAQLKKAGITPSRNASVSVEKQDTSTLFVVDAIYMSKKAHDPTGQNQFSLNDQDVRNMLLHVENHMITVNSTPKPAPAQKLQNPVAKAENHTASGSSAPKLSFAQKIQGQEIKFNRDDSIAGQDGYVAPSTTAAALLTDKCTKVFANQGGLEQVIAKYNSTNKDMHFSTFAGNKGHMPLLELDASKQNLIIRLPNSAEWQSSMKLEEHGANIASLIPDDDVSHEKEILSKHGVEYAYKITFSVTEVRVLFGRLGMHDEKFERDFLQANNLSPLPHNYGKPQEQLNC